MKNRRRYTTAYKVLAWVIILMLVFSLIAQALVR